MAIQKIFCYVLRNNFFIIVESFIVAVAHFCCYLIPYMQKLPKIKIISRV